MLIVDKYIAKTVLYATLMVFLIFIGLRLFIDVFGELSSMGHGHYGISQVLSYVLLSMPMNIYQLYPTIALLGALSALGLLAANNELTIIRISGCSIARISWAVIKTALLLTIVMTMVGELLGPSLGAYAEKRKAIAQYGSLSDASKINLWLREDNSYINIGRAQNNAELIDITRFLFSDSGQLVSASYAKHAKLINDKWYFYDVRTTYFYPGHVTTATSAEADWALRFKPHLLITTEPEQMSLQRLLQQVKYNKINGLDATTYLLAFWQRLFQPLATLVMVFLAIPFIFGPLRSSTMGLRILSGVMAGLAFYITNNFFGPFSMVYQIPPMIAAAIPMILFFIIGLLLMWRKS